ncbi:MAG: hypothetical protein ACREOU_03980 [Candidatus Eiseniibacteriota bacterium]
MAPVILFTLSFVLGVVLLGAFQFVIDRLLVDRQGWETETFITMAVIFLCAAVAFGIGLVQLFVWASRRPRETHA